MNVHFKTHLIRESKNPEAVIAILKSKFKSFPFWVENGAVWVRGVFNRTDLAGFRTVARAA